MLSSLIHLCWSINHFPAITAWEHVFVPREYLVPHLEELFIRYMHTCIFVICVYDGIHVYIKFPFFANHTFYNALFLFHTLKCICAIPFTVVKVVSSCVGDFVCTYIFIMAVLIFISSFCNITIHHSVVIVPVAPVTTECVCTQNIKPQSLIDPCCDNQC